MELGVRLHLPEVSLSNTARGLERFGVERSRTAVDDWVQKADRQPAADTNPNRVSVDETVIQIGDHQYWLDAAVGPETNKVIHTRLFSTTTTALAERFPWELLENHDVEVAVFLVDGAQHPQAALHRHGPRFRYEKRESEEYRAYLLREKTTYLFILKLF